MGIDMNTRGAAVRIITGIEEAFLVEVAKQELLDPAGHAGDDLHAMIEVEDVEEASTLEGLFAAFRQVLVRDADGTVVSCFGHDGRFFDPEALFQALAGGLVTGSWYAYQTDNDERVLSVRDGGASTAFVPEGIMGLERVEQDITHGYYLPRIEEVPFEHDAGDDAKVTALARAATGHDDLLEGIVPPMDWDAGPNQLGHLSELRPYVLAPAG